MDPTEERITRARHKIELVETQLREVERTPDPVLARAYLVNCAKHLRDAADLLDDNRRLT
jgi:hypothetical protein